MKEQLERHKLCQQKAHAAGRKLREKEDGLAEAGGGAAAEAPLLGRRVERSRPSCGCRLVSLVKFCSACIFCRGVIIVKILIFHSVVFS